MLSERPKVLVLLSGGLDSTLAVKAMLEQGLNVEAAVFTTPFCLCDKCAAESVVKRFAIKMHSFFLGQEYLDLVANPPHGYGSQMNPCIDCRVLMFKKAKELAEKLGAECLVTGEVLGERPFSQTKHAMEVIERNADLEGKILRPLSAKLLPETELEKSGHINRQKLHSICGRRRLPQMELAKEWKIKDYPCPSGGCLLTDPRFAQRLKDLLKHNKCLKIEDVALLKIGRHFRVDGYKFVVGRNEQENHKLLELATQKKQPLLEVAGNMSPITLLEANCPDNVCDKAAKVTVRYSDAEKRSEVDVKKVLAGNVTAIIRATAASDEEIEQIRI
jgi:tRNA U34 2-thiouridine synthase MnmA/TrmU